MACKEHIHKYERKILGGRKIVFKEIDGKKRRYIEKSSGYEVYLCIFPGCRSRIAAEVAEGAISSCWVCGEQLVLNKDNLKLKRPTHEWCRKVRSSL